MQSFEMRKGGLKLTEEGRPSEKEDREKNAAPDLRVVEHRSSQGAKEGESEEGHVDAQGTAAGGEGARGPVEECVPTEEEDSPRIAELKARADEYLDHLQRLKADFENYRKRVNREREADWGRARGNLILSLIPFIDDMRRLLESAAPGGDSRGLIEGVRLIEKGILDFLRKEGLVEIDAQGRQFDPSLHEAIEVRRTDLPEKDGMVAEVLVPGYLYREALLRPARVSVFRFEERIQPEAKEADEHTSPGEE